MEEEEEGRVSIRGSTPALGSERRIMKLETSFFFPPVVQGNAESAQVMGV